MKIKNIILFLCFFAIPSLAISQNDADSLHKDIEKVVDSLINKFSFYPLLEDKESFLQELRANLQDTSNNNDFAIALHKEIIKLGDAHSGVKDLKDLLAKKGTIPYNIYWQANSDVDRKYIITNSSCNARLYKKEDFISSGVDQIKRPYLIEIDEVPLSVWVNAAEKYIAGSEARKARRATNFLIYLNQLRQDLNKTVEEEFSFKIASDPEGANALIVQGKLTYKTDDDDHDYCSNTSEPYQIESLGDKLSHFTIENENIISVSSDFPGAVPYIKIKKMYYYFRAEEKSEVATVKRILDGVVKSSGKNKMIIDFRGNGGGARDLLLLLYPFLTDSNIPIIGNVAASRKELNGKLLMDDYDAATSRYLFDASSEFLSAYESEVARDFASNFKADISSLSTLRDDSYLTQYGKFGYMLLSRKQSHISKLIEDATVEKILERAMAEEEIMPSKEAIIRKQIRKIVEDLNSRGDYYFDQIIGKELPNYKKPRDIIILMDENNFSATDIMLGAIQNIPGVTLIGFNSSGGSSKRVIYNLPYSDIEFGLGSMLSFQPNGKPYDSNGIEADIIIEQPPEYYLGYYNAEAPVVEAEKIEFLLGYDNVLKYAMQLNYTDAQRELFTGNWTYDSELDLIYRINEGSRDVECFSIDGSNCEWGRNKDQMGAELNNTPDAEVIPLSCGAQHAKYWHVTGYNTRGHWCYKLKENMQ